jgi:PAS domain S-box-containing protein
MTAISLEASESRYRRLFETAQDGILIIDEDSERIIDANPFILEMTEFGLDEILGKQLWELGFIEDEHVARNSLMELKKKGYVRYEDIPLRSKTGKRRQVEFVSNSYQVDGSKIIQCNIRDITDRKIIEAKLSFINNKLNLLSSITRHDMLNQISIALGCLELHKQTNSEQSREALRQKIERTILEIQRQMGTSKPEWLSISEVVLKLPVAKEIKNLHFGESLGKIRIFADPMLGKVFSNLLANSAKHGEGVTEVKIDCLIQSDAVIIIYQDNGKGIEPEQKEKIFEKGYGKGSGLGLFLSREILSITEITIKENGTPGKGARFEIRVPKDGYR